jgi:hypothetical protein
MRPGLPARALGPSIVSLNTNEFFNPPPPSGKNGDDWLQDTGVQALVKVRQQLADSVRGRRTELGEVARVRSTFLCVDAIEQQFHTLKFFFIPSKFVSYLENFFHTFIQ